MRVAITGGGTGGHLAIAKAITEALNARGHKPIYIGSTHGQDRAWFEEDAGFEKCYFFETSGVVNQRKLGKVASLINILKYAFTCKTLFSKHKIDTVFSVGGYSAAPAAIAAVLFRKPLYIHEQNAVMGSLNKLLKPFAKALFSSYFEDSPLKDYPVREYFFDHARTRDKLETIIFLGGSQGATAINGFAMQIAPVLKEKGIKIIHQSGKRDFEGLQQFYKEHEIDVDLFAFTPDIVSKLQKSDFAICRAGAGTVWELCASKLPALFVPYPYAAKNHQYHNAQFLVEKSLAYMRLQEDLCSDDIAYILDADIQQMSKGLGEMIAPNGAKAIVDFMLKESLR